MFQLLLTQNYLIEATWTNLTLCMQVDWAKSVILIGHAEILNGNIAYAHNIPSSELILTDSIALTYGNTVDTRTLSGLISQ